jgi:hypothetical protein
MKIRSSPFEEIPNDAAPTRFVFLPVLVLTGLWMWKGWAGRQLISKGSPLQHPAANARELGTPSP